MNISDWIDDSRNIVNWFGELYNGNKQLLFLEKRKDVCMYSLFFPCFAAEKTKKSIVIIVVRIKHCYRTNLLYPFRKASPSSYFRWVLLRDYRAFFFLDSLYCAKIGSHKYVRKNKRKKEKEEVIGDVYMCHRLSKIHGT